jgi:aldose 1-epimerase
MQTYTLSNGAGLVVRFIAFGGAIVGVRVPDRDGVAADVVLGFDSVDAYANDTRYIGTLIGRYTNRFTLDGHEYTLTRGDGGHHLHGGRRGFHKATWNVVMDGAGTTATLTHVSPDGDEGYPGALEATVTYSVTANDELVVDYRATTDRPTPVGFTQHSYFNLGGHDRGDVLDHELTVHASRYTPVDASLIPTGEIRAVCGTPFDFLTPHVIGSRIDASDPQLAFAGGYDHNFVIDRDAAAPGEAVIAARLHEPRSGRTLDVFTSEPGIQVYTGNALGGRVTGKDWRVYGRRSGICLEPQRFPDSPNQEAFPSCILRPGEEYRSRSVYRFTVGERR